MPTLSDRSESIPAVDGVLSADQVAATARSIVAMQEPSGAVPWTPGEHTDIWNHVEAAMAMLVGGEVEVEVVQDAAAVRVTVRDSGPGVAPELVEEVFTQGFTTKVANGGPRGFGLALTWTICTRRGGSVSVRNDDGAVFSACLPTPGRVSGAHRASTPA